MFGNPFFLVHHGKMWDELLMFLFRNLKGQEYNDLIGESVMLSSQKRVFMSRTALKGRAANQNRNRVANGARRRVTSENHTAK